MSHDAIAREFPPVSPDGPDAGVPVDDAGVLAGVAAALGAAGGHGFRTAVSALARSLVPGVGDWCTVHGRGEDGQLALLAASHVDPLRAQALRRAERQGPLRATLEGQCLYDRVLQTGRSVLCTDLRSAECVRVAGDAVRGAALEEAGTRDVLIVPLAWSPDGTTLTATLALATGDSGRRLGEDTVRLAGRIASLAGVMLAQVRRLEAAEQSRAESELARQQVTVALDTVDEGFLTVDGAWRVTFANPAGAALLGRTRDALTGSDLRTIAAGDVPLFAPCERAMGDGEPVSWQHHDAARGTWMSVRAFPAPHGMSVHLLDVTAQHRAEQAMRDLVAHAEHARQEAVAANTAKAEFLASMSHELRTPLNAIMGYVSLIADGISGPVTPPQSQQLSRITSSARHLLTLIEEILVYARLESGAERAYLEAIDGRDLAREAAQLVEPVIETQGLRFEVDLAAEALPMRTDARKVRQVLLNLLANAARFTPPRGTVALGVHADGTGGVAFVVRDTGIGIDPGHLERIFEPFWQVEQSLTRRVGGTGLGLSVCRRYARLLGGDVTVDSALGQGSRFTVRLPRESRDPDAD